MKRLGIYQLYDRDGHVDEFKYVILESLLKVLDSLIIVINGHIEPKGLSRLKLYTDDIHIRIEDQGFDAGAFRDVFLKFYVHDFWKQWDEVVLFNDTFYGPFYSWEIIFKQMEKEQIDFWGLEKYIPKKPSFENSEYNYQAYIIPYFLVIKRKLLINDVFTKFWLDLGYPTNKSEGVKAYEAKLTRYFCDAGFTYTTWLDVKGLYNCELGKKFRMHYAYDILKDYQFPIVKVKIFSVINSLTANKILDYIDEETSYDINLIEQHLKRLNSLDMLCPYSPAQLQRFVECHKRIFIFGHGDYGKGMEEYFYKQNWHFHAFIVSDPIHDNEKSLKDITPEATDGIILALGVPGLVDEVKGQIEGIFKKEQIMYPKL